MRRVRRVLRHASLVSLVAAAVYAQGMDGRVTVQISDPTGGGVPATVELSARSPEFFARSLADAEGSAVFRRVPPGTYLVVIQAPGFSPAERRVEVSSAVPERIAVSLEVAAVEGSVTVSSSPPLFEPLRPSQGTRSGREALDRAIATGLGRSTIDIVTTMPGWLLEANAVLHPRGSEYDTQYVMDGMPLYENRSIAFAPAFENSEFEAVTVLTAGIPAEYGRRLGGVIALDTRRNPGQGHHASMTLASGSYGTRIGSFRHQFARRGTELAVGVQGGATDRYLDPPSVENFTNKASSGGGNFRFARDLTARDRFTAYARTNRTGFLVPNDLVQQEAGQRQDRRAQETAGQIHYQGAVRSSVLVSARAMVRDLTSALWSNERSTPVWVQQGRGFREGVFMGDVTFNGERHTVKAGGDLRINWVRERFALSESGGPSAVDLDFRDRRRSLEASAFVQDQIRFRNFSLSAGMRLDRYELLVEDTAFSPRVAAGYFIPRIDLQIYASYDRIFQPPPIENLLLSSSAPGLGLDQVEGSLPVPASRANFFEVGVRKPLVDTMRLEAKHFWRSFRNPIDDDVFLNTGLSFPITFASARIRGTEARLELPAWRGVTAVASFSNQLGLTQSPVTGGLFIEGGEAEELRNVATEFPISQDQRNTVAAMVRFEIHPRLWVAVGTRYGSGLPIELEDDDEDDDNDDHDEDEDGDDGDDDDDRSGMGEQPIARAILDQVNFARSRVRPNFSLDFSVGARVWNRSPRRSATIQFDVRNVTDRLNVINFSGLFSGTALAPGRQATVQLRVRL